MAIESFCGYKCYCTADDNSFRFGLTGNGTVYNILKSFWTKTRLCYRIYFNIGLDGGAITLRKVGQYLFDSLCAGSLGGMEVPSAFVCSGVFKIFHQKTALGTSRNMNHFDFTRCCAGTFAELLRSMDCVSGLFYVFLSQCGNTAVLLDSNKHTEEPGDAIVG